MLRSIRMCEYLIIEALTIQKSYLMFFCNSVPRLCFFSFSFSSLFFNFILVLFFLVLFISSFSFLLLLLRILFRIRRRLLLHILLHLFLLRRPFYLDFFFYYYSLFLIFINMIFIFCFSIFYLILYVFIIVSYVYFTHVSVILSSTFSAFLRLSYGSPISSSLYCSSTTAFKIFLFCFIFIE